MKQFGNPEDIWTIKLGNSVGSFQFTIKMLMLFDGVTEIRHDNTLEAFDCDDNGTSCDLDIAYTTTNGICLDCSLPFWVVRGRQILCRNSAPMGPNPYFEDRGSVLFPTLKVRCPYGETADPTNSFCRTCLNTSCALCKTGNLNHCLGCPYDSL